MGAWTTSSLQGVQPATQEHAKIYWPWPGPWALAVRRPLDFGAVLNLAACALAACTHLAAAHACPHQPPKQA